MMSLGVAQKLFVLAIVAIVASASDSVERACKDTAVAGSGSCPESAEVSFLQSQLTLDKRDEPAPADSTLLEASSESWMDRSAARVASHGVTSGIIVGIIVFVLVFMALVAPADWKGMIGTSDSKSSASSDIVTGIGNGPANVAGTDTGSATVAGAGNGPPIKTVLFFVLSHSLCGSTLTVVNKWAMNSFHPPVAAALDHHHGYVWTLSLLQFLTSALVAKLVGVFGLAKCEPLEWKQAVAYFPAAGMFMISVVAGNSVMMLSNVSSFLVLRSLVPLPVAISEMFIYKDPMPPALTWAALGLVICGSVQYAASSGGFHFGAAAWAMMFLVAMPIDALLVKHAISASKLSSWGFVYYNNALSSIPLVVYVVYFELPNKEAFFAMLSALVSPEARVAVGTSCLIGIALSYFQMTTRYYISATAFMVLGIVNKFLTVFWNEVFIGRSNIFALMGVLLTLVGAVVWQVSMGFNSVKVRKQSEATPNTAMLAFVATVGALVVAGFVQNSIMPHGK